MYWETYANIIVLM